MKSPKDFAHAWGIKSINAGRKLKRLGIKPVEWKGRVPYYSDECFEKLTDIKPKEIDPSYIPYSEVRKHFDEKVLDKSVKNTLRKNGVKVKLIDSGISYYSKDEVENYLMNKYKKRESNPKFDTLSNIRYRVSIFNNNRLIVKWIGLKYDRCLIRIKELLSNNIDFCVRSYNIEQF